MPGCKVICNCGVSVLGNTGTGCIPIRKVTKKNAWMPIYDSTGARNYIDLTVDLDEETFQDLINEADASKRLYPLPSFKDPKDNRADSIRESFPDGTSQFIQDGVRTFEALIIGKDASPELLGELNKARCADVGVIAIDKDGNIYAEISEDQTKAYPIRLDSDSISATEIQPTDTTGYKIKINYNFHPDVQDSCIGVIASTEIGDAEPLFWRGLVNAYARFSNISTTGLTVELYTKFGTPKNPERVKGLIDTDFVSPVGGATAELRNVTQAADVSISGVTESGGTSTDDGGFYDLVFGAQGSADVLAINCVKVGYDFSNVKISRPAIP